MDEEHKYLLRKARPFIVQNLADVEAVCDQLIAFEILTESMVDEIMSKPSNAGKTRALLSVLVMRGPQAFDSFYEVMKITKNETIVDILKPKGDKKFQSLPRHRHLESLSTSSAKLVRASSLPEQVIPPLYSGDLGQQHFMSVQPQGHLDDTKAEYGEYNEYGMLLSNQTASKQVLGATAQVSELGDFSTGVLVSGFEQHVSGIVSEASSQKGEIDRDMDNVHQSGYGDPTPNVDHSSDRWRSAPSDTILPVQSFGNLRARSEQGHGVHVPRDDEHCENAEGQTSLTSETGDLDDIKHEGNGWPRTRIHSRPLVDLSIQQPCSRQQVRQLAMDVANNRVYECDPKFQRRLVIINNSVFLPSSGLPPRTTANIDATSLDLLFKKLSYSTKTYSDCSCQRMMEVLRGESTGQSLNRLDTFVLVIMSHGEGEKIYGTEGEAIDIGNITELFNENHCRALQGKPKLFFISASRRQQNKSSGEDCAASDLENVEYDSLSLGMLNSLVSMTTDSGRTEPSNMFIARATTQCNAMFKGISFGSQFIQAFIHVIKEHSSTLDLITLMEKMNQLVKRPSGSPFKLVEYTNILSKKFYFLDTNTTASLAMSI
ncbi:uncharacterized protein LOC110462768 [Mizuhopecten yessoensis]|uniref:Caspase-7 n=1 Tax=Mizuhopecten yessoensis TaxID=6573 RepID=A0A210PXK9_MIZYE|nr:uncharacterized protein LOC110462768 [Mizuhopecten yessoensis]XP_021372593.1 uncharacterized protein LOC110462768 [Mizuhopecten yessoensis]OWF41223.1 Caspase-7 [Mizuhopecten yessoensis]